MEKQKWDFQKLVDEKREDMKEGVISIVDRFKKNEKARALMAPAIIEDEAVRLASQENSRAYLIRKDKQDEMPFWMWCTLYFVLGMLFMITVDNVTFGWEELVPLINGIIG